MQKFIKLFSVLNKEIKIGLIGVLAAGAILSCGTGDSNGGVDREEDNRTEGIAQPGAVSKAQPEESLDVITKKAEGGEPDAQYKLAVRYWIGNKGVKQNPQEAVKWYKRAAENGHTKAQYRIGSFYEHGLGGLNKNLNTALKWYRLAAKQGDADAQRRLDRLSSVGLRP